MLSEESSATTPVLIASSTTALRADWVLFRFFPLILSPFKSTSSKSLNLDTISLKSFPARALVKSFDLMVASSSASPTSSNMDLYSGYFFTTPSTEDCTLSNAVFALSIADVSPDARASL